MIDLISRQAALTAIESLISARRTWISDAKWTIQGLDAAHREIQALPPASFENHDEIKSYSKDTISRQAAIEDWKNDFKGYVNALNIPRDDYNGIMAYIDELPSADRWIPCSERLPEENGLYLVTERYKNCTDITIRFFYILEDEPTWAVVKQTEVVAWMPMPKPWEGEGHE